MRVYGLPKSSGVAEPDEPISVNELIGLLQRVPEHMRDTAMVRAQNGGYDSYNEEVRVSGVTASMEDGQLYVDIIGG